MKTSVPNQGRAFTLVELLVVISIIAILAAILLPALARAKVQGQIHKAKLQIGQIVMAINQYESACNNFPVSSDAKTSVAGLSEDFTYGTGGIAPLKTPTGTAPLLASGSYQTNNAEVIAILMDLESYGDGRPTINKGHVKNPQQTKFLDAQMVSDTASPGVGLDGVYRDPWGNPYIITLDLNYDGKARDAFYRSHITSQMKPGQPSGYFGLFNSHTPPGSDFFECNSPMMVWSAGPDKTIDPANAVNQGANKDNVLSWK